MPLRPPVAAEPARLVPLGRLVAGHGVRGLARVKPFNPGSPALRECSEVWLSPPRGAVRTPARVLECRPHGRVFLMRFEGIDSLNALEPWIGSSVDVDADALAEPAPGEVYHHETVGLEVRTTGDRHVGTIVEVMAMPANDVWVVRDEAGAGDERREWLIPAVAPIVARIDLKRRVAWIDPIPGLLDG